MCGVIGIASQSSVVSKIYDGLSLLQHRGQDAAGIATVHDGKLRRRKSCGLVRDVFAKKHIDRLQGNIGIGHVRYPTAGSDNAAEAQPLYVNSPYGIVLAHNGNLVNVDEIIEDLIDGDLRHINTQSDSEILLNVFAHELGKVATGSTLPAEDVFKACDEVMGRCNGGYAVVGVVLNQGLFAFRDPNGIRPLIMGERRTDLGVEYAFASESVALSGIGFDIVRDVRPGETIYVDVNGVVHYHEGLYRSSHHPCIFEYVYFARPDSIIDGVSVYKSRKTMGEMLAAKILKCSWSEDIDVVIPIPDTGRTPALEVAKDLGVKYREGFVKNRYIGRTFIMPNQDIRIDSVRKKLSPMSMEFEGKNVLLVDDSIVRGTTSEQIIRMVRTCGAKKVFFASASPPVTNINAYGINTPTLSELLAHNRTVDQMCGIIGADELIFQDLNDLHKCIQLGNPNLTSFDDSCFSGEYCTGDVGQ